MFGRKKTKDVDWLSGAQPAPTAPPQGQTITTPSGAQIVIPQGVQIMQPSPEQMKQVMQMAEGFMGRDLDGDGKVAGAAQGEGTVVDQLERLAKLRDSGALTDAEFAAEKAKLLK